MDNNTLQVYEDEIQSLEEEIKLLTEEYEDSQEESTFYSDKEILKSLKAFQRECRRESKGREVLPNLKDQLESLERDLSFLMKLTGIQFTSHSKKTVEKTGNRTLQKHRLSVTCYSLSFQLEFQLLEMQDKEDGSAIVTDLSVVTDSRENLDVNRFLLSTEEHGSLLSFFRRLSSYAEWYEHRQCTFLHFKEKYPDIVALPEGLHGGYIVLKNPCNSAFELLVVWKLHLDEEGRTTPVLDLLTKVPEQVMGQNVAAVETAPDRFRSMLHLLGIEAALENLIRAVGVAERG